MAIENDKNTYLILIFKKICNQKNLYSYNYLIIFNQQKNKLASIILVFGKTSSFSDKEN
jgi:hypothetical protein